MSPRFASRSPRQQTNETRRRALTRAGSTTWNAPHRSASAGRVRIKRSAGTRD